MSEKVRSIPFYAGSHSAVISTAQAFCLALQGWTI